MKKLLASLILLYTFSPAAFCQDYKTSSDLGNGFKIVYQTKPDALITVSLK